MERLVRMILPFHLTIETVDGTRKLGQNKTEAQRAGAVAGLRAWPERAARMILADFMEAQ